MSVGTQEAAAIQHARIVLDFNPAHIFGPGKTPPIIMCNASTDSSGTVDAVNLEELKNVLEKEPKEEIGILYDAIMKELGISVSASEHDNGNNSANANNVSGVRKGEPPNTNSNNDRSDGSSNKIRRMSKVISTTTSESQREKVECLLDCYASIAGGSTLPSTWEGVPVVWAGVRLPRKN